MNTPLTIGPATLHHGDCLEVLRTLPDNSVDAVVTDPPYGLRFMGKHWDCDVPGVDVWRECLRVLKPGGHLLAFFGTRTYHRGAVAVEDAGFELRDMIAWVYGSGFPKSLDVSKADRDEGCDGGVGALRDGGRQNTSPRRNHHPTVKPTALMRYLCRLVTPPGGVILDPFMGSGSTGKAAMLEGFRFIGIEREAEYVEIAAGRIGAAEQVAAGGCDVAERGGVQTQEG